MSPRTGRPRSENPKDKAIRIRVTSEEKEAIMAFSKEHNVGLLDLIRIGMKVVEGEK